MNKDFEIDRKLLTPSKLPTKRAAYSDRTALLMATLSKIAYVDFENEKFSTLETELGEIGYKLAGGKPICHENGTQAFVTVQKGDNPKFIVICFRGTTDWKDWKTNLKYSSVKIKDPKNKFKNIGHMHKGFHTAYQPIKGTVNDIEDVNAVDGPIDYSVAFEINKRLECYRKSICGSIVNEINEKLESYKKSLPIYITGHSLGGALAVVATWYMSMPKLAACYTFGAPKVGDGGPLGRFRTPIYRVVNGRDPVPDLPPSYANVKLLKRITHSINLLCSDEVIPDKGFMHYGDLKYIPTGVKNKNLRVLPGVSRCHVVKRLFTTPLIKSQRFIGYHDIEQYQKKLQIIAKNRNPV